MSAGNILFQLANLSKTLWVGGTWAVGYLAVPILFRDQPDRQLAGMLAGNMFTWMALVGLVCGLYLLAYHFLQPGRANWKTRSFLLPASMLLLVLVGHFAIQPVMESLKIQALPQEVMNSAFASQFKMLHGISSILYLLQSLLGLALVFSPLVRADKA